MLLQNSQWEPWLDTLLNEDPFWGYMRGVNLISWIIAITVMYVANYIFFLRAKRTDLDSQKALFRSFGLFFGIMGITRICFVFAYFIEPYYNLLLSIGYTTGAISLLPLILTLEKYLITQTKRFFSIVGIILTILGVVFLVLTFFTPTISEVSRSLQNVGMPILALAFVILYSIVIKYSTGTIRTKAIMTLLGMFIFVAGILFDSETLLEQNPATMHIAPIVFSIGIIITTMFQRSD
jgi:hypothetical protein